MQERNRAEREAARQKRMLEELEREREEVRASGSTLSDGCCHRGTGGSIGAGDTHKPAALPAADSCPGSQPATL
eukprot:COSAG01_NODE_1444_length_10282_cov_17.103506_12_plen_74_part_00